MTIGLFPIVNSFSLNRAVSSARSARWHTGRLKINPAKNRKKDGDKSAAAFLFGRCKTIGLRISGHTAAGIFIDFTEEHKSLGTNSTSTVHTSHAASCKHQRKQVRRSEKFKSEIPRQRSPYAMKCEERSQEETERQERRARGDAWRLAKNILKLKEKDKATFFSPTNGWSPSAIRDKTGGKRICCRLRSEQCTC